MSVAYWPYKSESGCDVEFVLFSRLPPNLDSGLTLANNPPNFNLIPFVIALLAAFKFRIFCEATMVMHRRATLYSADKVSRLLYEEDDDSEMESGTSKEEEAKLEHQLGIFGEESR